MELAHTYPKTSGSLTNLTMVPYHVLRRTRLNYELKLLPNLRSLPLNAQRFIINKFPRPLFRMSPVISLIQIALTEQ